MLLSFIKNNKYSSITFICLSLCSVSSWSAQKVALVIGNNNYFPEIGALANPVNDAVAIDQKLKNMGFETILVKNGTKSQMLDALDDFKEKLQSGSTAIFYYAGHGVEANGKNYLIPVDAKMPRNEDRYSDDFFDMREKAMQAMLYSAAENKILIIDACRDNPAAKKSRGIGGAGRGFTRTGIDDMHNAGKVGLFFSTLSGSVALDGDNSRHSPFTAALLTHLDKPNLTWPELVADVSETVRQSTKGQQVWSEGGAELARFKLLPVAETQPTPVVTPALPDAELVYWDSIKNSTDAKEYTTYLNQFPKGKFAELALSRQAKYEQLALSQIRSQKTTNIEDEKRAYFAAYQAFKERGPNKAIAPMNDFIKNYPYSTYVPSAYYWLGEFYLAANPADVANAKKSFKIVVEQFGDNSKAASALLKLGSLADVDGNIKEASNYMFKIINDFPQTPEAKAADAYLSVQNVIIKNHNKKR